MKGIFRNMHPWAGKLQGRGNFARAHRLIEGFVGCLPTPTSSHANRVRGNWGESRQNFSADTCFPKSRTSLGAQKTNQLQESIPKTTTTKKNFAAFKNMPSATYGKVSIGSFKMLSARCISHDRLFLFVVSHNGPLRGTVGWTWPLAAGVRTSYVASQQFVFILLTFEISAKKYASITDFNE